MKIELFHLPGCPAYKRALANVKDALRAEGLPETVETVPVFSYEDAQAKRFLGSPTIRVGGIDVEGASADMRGYIYGPRFYESGGRIEWPPTVTQIRQALQRARKASRQRGKLAQTTPEESQLWQ